MKTTVFFRAPSGHRVALEGELENYRSILEEGGKRGFVPEDRPARGWVFPLAQHESFNWALIGARPGEITDEKGQRWAGVWWDGQFYKRRDLEQNDKKDMGQAIKYSRGAKPFEDGPEVEGEDNSNFKYVTLVVFRGDGKARDWWAKTQGGSSQSKPTQLAAPPPAPEKVAVLPDPQPAGTLTQDQLGQIGQLMAAAGLVAADDAKQGEKINVAHSQRMFFSFLMGVEKPIAGFKTLEAKVALEVLERYGSFTAEGDGSQSYKPNNRRIQAEFKRWQIERPVAFDQLGRSA